MIAAIGKVAALYGRGVPTSLQFGEELAYQIRAGTPQAVLWGDGVVTLTVDVAAIERSLKW